MISQKVAIENKRGKTISGVIEWPANMVVQAYGIFAHCFTCGKNSYAARNICRALASRGIAILRFDFTGIGSSEGIFANTNFTTNIHDLLDMIDYMEENDMPPQLLIGHSLGGAAVLFAGGQRDVVKAITTIGAPATPEHVKHLLPENLSELDSDETIEVQLGIHKMKMKKQFLEDLEKHNTAESLFSLKQAVLIAHSPDDKMVNIKNAEKIFTALHHPKCFLSLDGMRHLLLKDENAAYVGNVVYEWAQRYLEIMEIEEDEIKDPKTSAVLDNDHYTTEIRAGKHALISDEPTSVGGKNKGPTPYQLVSAGLAACTAMTLRMYSQQKGWELGEIKVEVDHEKKHCEDCRENGKIDHFTRRISIETDLTEKQEMKIISIANKCPVHRTLTGNIKIPTEKVN